MAAAAAVLVATPKQAAEVEQEMPTILAMVLGVDTLAQFVPPSVVATGAVVPAAWHA